MTLDPATRRLIDDAERYCADAGIKLSSLGLYAVGNSRLFASLKAGRPCLTTTIERVRRYIEDNPRGDASTGGSEPNPKSNPAVNANASAAVAAE